MPARFSLSLLGTALLLASLASPSHAAAPTRHFVISPESEFSYFVKTKLLGLFDEDVSGSNRQVTGAISLTNGHATGWLEAPVLGFFSAITARDKHVAQLLGHPIVPIVRFELMRLEELDVNRQEGSMVAFGSLMANGRPFQLKVPLSYRVHEGKIRLSGEVAAKFIDFNISPPILGFVLKRTPDDFRLRVNVIATEQPPESR